MRHQLPSGENVSHVTLWKRANRGKYQANLTRRKEAARLLALAYKLAYPCVDCGEDDPIVLEFDHRDPSRKTRDVSWLVKQPRSLKTILDEIEKCNVRCANCHRRRTLVQRGGKW